MLKSVEATRIIRKVYINNYLYVCHWYLKYSIYFRKHHFCSHVRKFSNDGRFDSIDRSDEDLHEANIDTIESFKVNSDNVNTSQYQCTVGVPGPWGAGNTGLWCDVDHGYSQTSCAPGICWCSSSDTVSPANCCWSEATHIIRERIK